MAINIERFKDRIFLRSPWYPGCAEEAKSVPGASWRKTEKVWSYPLSLTTCREMREVFGKRLNIGPALYEWAKAEVAKETELHALGRKYDAELTLVPQIAPDLAVAMQTRTYQKSGAAFIARARSTLIADEPSMGKSVMALAGIMESGAWEGQHLVVAPVTALDSTWGRQIRAWTPGVAFAMPDGRAKREKVIQEFLDSDAKAKFLIVNPAMLMVKVSPHCKKCNAFQSQIYPGKQKHAVKEYEKHDIEGHVFQPMIEKHAWPQLHEVVWNSVIIDESHEILAAYRPSNVTQSVEGIKRLKTVENAPRICLTGTPLRGKEQRIWGTLDVLGAVNGGYWPWVSTYFQIDDNGFGKTIKDLKPEKEEDFYKMLDVAVLRRLKSEVRDDLPDNLTEDHWVEMSPKHAKQYKEFLDEGEVVLGEGILSSSGVLSALTRLKQLAFGLWDITGYREVDDVRIPVLAPGSESPKVERLLSLLRERGVTGNPKEDWLPESGGHKYVITSQFTQVVDYIEHHFNKAGIETLKITGAVTGKKRTAVIKQFDESYDGPRVLLMNTKAGGSSIDLDTFCDDLFIVDETFVDDDQTQVKGRIDNRKGEVRVRTFHYLRTLGTIEEEIATGNMTQSHRAAALLDVRRGIDVKLRSIGKK